MNLADVIPLESRRERARRDTTPEPIPFPLYEREQRRLRVAILTAGLAVSCAVLGVAVLLG